MQRYQGKVHFLAAGPPRSKRNSSGGMQGKCGHPATHSTFDQSASDELANFIWREKVGQ